MLCNEFDPCREAVINPADHYAPIEGFPKLCIGIFSHVIVEEMVEKYHGEVIAQIKFCTGTVPVYRLEAGGLEAALFLPHVGAASAGSFIENLVAWGGRHFVFCGSCGVLRHDIADGHLILPTAAVRDEGLSYHYLPPSDEVELSPACVEAARQAMEALGLPYVEGKTWTTDGFFRETRGKMERRKEQGCVCVEMECAAPVSYTHLDVYKRQEKYRTTMDYYHYYSINAYNFWALIRWNWKSLPQGVAGSLLNLVGPVLALSLIHI